MQSVVEKEKSISELSISREEALSIVIQTIREKERYSFFGSRNLIRSFIEDKLLKIDPSSKPYLKNYPEYLINANIRLKLEFLDHFYDFYKENTNNVMANKLKLLENKENKHNREDQPSFLNYIKKMIDELMLEILNERHTVTTLELLSKGEYIVRMPKETPLHQSTKLLEQLSQLTSKLQEFMLDTTPADEIKNARVGKIYWLATSSKQELTNQGKQFYNLLGNLYIHAGLNEWKHGIVGKNEPSILKDLYARNLPKTPKSFVIDKQIMDMSETENSDFYISLAPRYVQQLIAFFVYGAATVEQRKLVNNTLCNVLPSCLMPAVYGYLGVLCNDILAEIKSKKSDSIVGKFLGDVKNSTKLINELSEMNPQLNVPFLEKSKINNYISGMKTLLNNLDRSVALDIALTSIREKIVLHKENLSLDKGAIKELNLVGDMADMETWIDKYWDSSKNQTLKEIFLKEVEGDRKFNNKDEVLRDYFNKECIGILTTLEPKLTASSEKGVVF